MLFILEICSHHWVNPFPDVGACTACQHFTWSRSDPWCQKRDLTQIVLHAFRLKQAHVLEDFSLS